MATNAGIRRDRILTTLAVLMGLMSLSNFSKPIGQSMDPAGNAGCLLRPPTARRRQRGHRSLFGLLLAAYAYGAWTMRRWVVPLAAHMPLTSS
jgi:hypothetical protein